MTTRAGWLVRLSAESGTGSIMIKAVSDRASSPRLGLSAPAPATPAAATGLSSSRQPWGMTPKAAQALSVYNLAAIVGLPPVRQVELELGLPHSTASAWIRKAKEQKLIGPERIK